MISKLLKRVLGLAVLLAIGSTACSLTGGDDSGSQQSISVEFIYPANNLSVAEGTDLQIQIVARVSDSAVANGRGITRVDLTVDGELVRTAVPVENPSVPTFVVDMNWLTTGAGLHVFEAVAYDNAAAASTPARLRLSVSGVTANPP